ncbi:Sll0314/Alr1548 family TPR repeat-containing protein [Umezakia ovalisporum]|jgi:tetratricopeptide (TPR) repeat protein|uniref:Tetratricopeptide repeat protein n=2 Tax=Umezakia ovalisporum TaxID=75695 RepID=A0AA43KEN7_9CYAN|nr:Sll0314/Alr1548 family TPR repeat-containing protein [Umezakia ovalisporum]MBI1241058.1 tetratricopeptide repeat protein [Nostoc sp. RI_552]MDH6055832.1 tetratricopeptide repeat protein [Umezakia ovalisporum FSS-43]MDH6063178.1 tetratricopeptide repeat protein [Umezakia ovalisporum FSS-62]MDH6068934.1 tetratricopeptide repeat protein [Umezakia ovalisporum APH033B]MDH6070640.1 tetratricopeptide repeat protein [Umezakia ovalisporum CobakiLakeA]
MHKRFFTRQSIGFTTLSQLVHTGFVAAIALNLWVNPSLAADPFRTQEPRNIGENTEAAFKAVFQQGNYPLAESYLQKAISSDPNEPLVYAMKASLAYANKDLSTLDSYSKKTLEAGEKLIATDELRGNMYTAVGHFFAGATILTREGVLKGTPEALNRLRKVYQHLDRAEAIAPQDPELNLLKGYMDLMLAVNLPFASPDEAIAKLKANAAPQYLAHRGIALAYRDLKQYSQALEYVNSALKSTSEHPELYYLKAQILRKQGEKAKSPSIMEEALVNFDKALTKRSQLPADLVRQIERERNNTFNHLNNLVD